MSAESLALLYARTFAIGIAVAAPVGAMGVLCIERTLHRGWRAGMATGAGIATADGSYAAIAAFGLTSVSALLVAWQTPLRLAGGAALMVLGLKAAFAAVPDAETSLDELEGSSLPRLYIGAVGLTLTNPLTIMAFAAVFASAGLAGLTSATAAAIATAGVASGSLAWWFALCTGVALVRHGLSVDARHNITRISGVAVAVFGVLAIASVFV